MSRLDQLLVERGLFPSREKARRAVMAGVVEVDGRVVDKPGTPTGTQCELRVREPAEPFVSRGGRKLDHALETFGLDVSGRLCMDVGASTGGFTDCLLQRGARRVVAVDVGYGQLDLGLREDPRVVVMERCNARHLAPDALEEPCSLVVMDVSFISLAKVVPAVLPHLTADGLLLPMIKPQFEAGRELVGKGGVVRDEEVRRRVVERTVERLAALGLELRGTCDAPIHGPRGNLETFALLVKR
ncbi:MAG: TlyA family RNA methyltransferase [Thermoanaerobaculia bacterium]